MTVLSPGLFLTGNSSDFRASCECGVTQPSTNFHDQAASHQFPEEDPDLRERLPAPHGPREVVAVAVEAFGGAVDAGDLGLA